MTNTQGCYTLRNTKWLAGNEHKANSRKINQEQQPGDSPQTLKPMGRPGHWGKSFAIVSTMSHNHIHKCIHGLFIFFCSCASAVRQHNSCFPSLVPTPNMSIGSNQTLCFASFNKASSSSSFFCMRLPIPSSMSLSLFQLIILLVTWDTRLAQRAEVLLVASTSAQLFPFLLSEIPELWIV